MSTLRNSVYDLYWDRKTGETMDGFKASKRRGEATFYGYAAGFAGVAIVGPAIALVTHPSVLLIGLAALYVCPVVASFYGARRYAENPSHVSKRPKPEPMTPEEAMAARYVRTPRRPMEGYRS